MEMKMMGCMGRDPTPTLAIKTCPECGHEVEVFSTDLTVDCPQCGFTVYNDAVDCVQWCQYAKSCVGEEAYNRYMEIAALQKEQREQELAAARA